MAKNPQKIKINKRQRRHRRVRAKITGTAVCPRLSIFRSHKHIYAQLIDDRKSQTLVSASDLELKKSVIKKKEMAKVGLAYQVGQLIAQKALKKKISKVVFDRGGYKYHGRVKAIADGAREGGLIF